MGVFWKLCRCLLTLNCGAELPQALGKGMKLEVTQLNVLSSPSCRLWSLGELCPQVIQFLFEMSLSQLQSCSLPWLFSDSKPEGTTNLFSPHCTFPIPYPLCQHHKQWEWVRNHLLRKTLFMWGKLSKGKLKNKFSSLCSCVVGQAGVLMLCSVPLPAAVQCQHGCRLGLSSLTRSGK